MSKIQRYDYDKVWGIEKHDLGDYVQYDDHAAIVAKLEQRNSGLEAARFAYASEFSLNSEGEPDVGSIHQNIRKLKADYAQLEADLAEAKIVAATDELRAIGELMRTQDNQCTADAIFVVERKCIVTGFDTDYCESHQIVWAIEDSMYFEGEDYFKELEDEFKRTGVEREDHTRTGFIVHWDFVQLFFTQSAADELISKHGHKYGGELRVSVESAYRNKEFQMVRNWLMSLPPVDAAIKEQQ